jgi:hypothetical protein
MTDHTLVGCRDCCQREDLDVCWFQLTDHVSRVQAAERYAMSVLIDG